MAPCPLVPLDTGQVATWLTSSATFLAQVVHASAKLELYHVPGYFIELSYCVSKRPNQPTQWQLYSADYFPDGPASTPLLTIFLSAIDLPN